MSTLTDAQLHSLARLGAIARLKELEAEAAALRKMFPGLKKVSEPVAESGAPAPISPKPRRRKRKKMSPEARKAHRERMTLYWAKKRAEQTAPVAGFEERAGATESAATTPAAPAKKKKATKKAKRTKKG